MHLGLKTFGIHQTLLLACGNSGVFGLKNGPHLIPFVIGLVLHKHSSWHTTISVWHTLSRDMQTGRHGALHPLPQIFSNLQYIWSKGSHAAGELTTLFSVTCFS